MSSARKHLGFAPGMCWFLGSKLLVKRKKRMSTSTKITPAQRECWEYVQQSWSRENIESILAWRTISVEARQGKYVQPCSGCGELCRDRHRSYKLNICIFCDTDCQPCFGNPKCWHLVEEFLPWAVKYLRGG